MGADSKLSAEAAARFVLGLNQGFTKEDVKRAYRRLALVFHPDKNAGQNEEEATKRFQAIAKAKDLLLGLADRSGGSAASAARDLNARKSAAETKSQPTFTALWVCGACQMRDLGSSPGASARTSTPCARATGATNCFCGHSFDEHRLIESKGAPKLRCSHPDCGCGEFSYVPAGALCTCGHVPTAHDARAFHGCQAAGCTCQTFHHAGMCACRHSWACHRTELRRLSGTPGKGASPKKTFCPWWKRSCSERDASPSSKSDSSSSIPASEPAPPKPRSRPASADVHGRCRPGTASAYRTSTTSSLFSGNFLRSRSQMFTGPRIRRPSSSRPSSARSTSASSQGVPLDVRGHPLNPSPPLGSKPPSAPPSARGPPLPSQGVRAREGETPKTHPGRPTPPSTPKARDAETPKSRPTPPSTPKVREAAAQPKMAPGPTPPGTPKAREEGFRTPGRAPATPATVTPVSTPRHSEASAAEPPPEPPPKPPRPRPSSAPPSRQGASASEVSRAVPTPARGSTIPSWRPPRPSSASTPRPSATPLPAKGTATDGVASSDGRATAGLTCKGSGLNSLRAEATATAFFPEEPAEPDAEPDTEPEAPEDDPQGAPTEEAPPRRETSSRFSEWKSKPPARSASCVGRPCGSASSVATAAAAAAAAAVARDGRPWWERLHERKALSKAHRRGGGLPRRPAAPEADSETTEKQEEKSSAPPRRATVAGLFSSRSRPPSARSRERRSTGDHNVDVGTSSASSTRPPTPRAEANGAEDRTADAQEDRESILGCKARPSWRSTSPFCGADGDDEGADNMDVARNNSQAMLKRLAALRRALETSVI